MLRVGAAVVMSDKALKSEKGAERPVATRYGCFLPDLTRLANANVHPTPGAHMGISGTGIKRESAIALDLNAKQFIADKPPFIAQTRATN